MFIGRQAKRTDRKPRVHEVIRAQISPGMTGFAFYFINATDRFAKLTEQCVQRNERRRREWTRRRYQQRP